jgi:hypothetical protein
MGHLPNSTAPGPDGLPNELLKALPHSLREMISNLFGLMACLQQTPAAWKHSHTKLLFKKGDEYDPGCYRPIGLHNTLYKLWTSIVSSALLEYSETHRMLSTSQEGFRPQKNCMRQIHTLIHTLEDAIHTDKNLFILYVDYSAAFNTISHDRLLEIMYDLGYPVDSIELVKDLYTGATTSVLCPGGGLSEPVIVERGSLQGDTLSPLLFLIFMEPLLRWLHAGSRGYKYGCLNSESNARHHTSSLAYADDLAILTGQSKDLQVQCRKLEAYDTWSGLSVNHKKCAATGALHGYAKIKGTHGNDHAHLHNLLYDRLTIHGQTIPYLHPDQPYKYLGVNITMTLNWQPEVHRIHQLAQTRCQQLLASHASPRQCRHILKTCIRPAILYSASVAALSTADLRKLDVTLVRTMKMAAGLPLSTPQVAVLLPHECMGFGLSSSLTDYVQGNVDMLTRSLNDDCRLGHVTRGLLKLLMTRALPGSVNMQAFRTRHSAWLTHKQLALAQTHGITIYIQGSPMQHPTSQLLLLLEQQFAEQPKVHHQLAQSARCLLSLGLDLPDLIDPASPPGQPCLVDTTTLRAIGGHCNRAHLEALNTLTTYLHGDTSMSPTEIC